MKIVCQISTVHPTFDDRIFYKECVSLAAAGYEVHLVVCADEDSVSHGVRIHALKKSKSRFGRIFLGIPAMRKALATKAGIFHFHDPELIVVGILLSLLGKKVIYDVHEDLSKQILYKQWIKFAWVRHSASVLVKVVEKIGQLFFARVVAATPDIAKNFNPMKTDVIANYAILSMIGNIQPIHEPTEKFVFIYVGGLTPDRGIAETIQALELVTDPCELWLLGPWLEEYRIQCEALNGFKKVKYKGYVRLEEVYPFIHRANAGIAILHPAKNYVTSLPVKAYEYMACKKPMIMSNFPYWQEIFKDSAEYVNPHSSVDIAKAMIKLIKDTEQCKRMGMSGYTLVTERYSWENEAKKLSNIYSNLSRGNS